MPQAAVEPSTADEAGRLNDWYSLHATVFLSGAAIMMVEIAAGRLICRHLGASVYAWTSVIGIVLAGIAFGSYIGGRFADRYTSPTALARMILAGSVAFACTSTLDRFASGWSTLWMLSWAARTAAHVAIVFFVPTCIAAMVTPVAMQRALDAGTQRGRTLGTLYAAGVLGSLVGTFLCGFFLISAIGTHGVFWASSAVMAWLAVLHNRESLPMGAWGVVAVVGTVLAGGSSDWMQQAGARLALRPPRPPGVLLSEESAYSYVEVERISRDPDIRTLKLDSLIHSEINLNDPSDLRYEYERIFAAATRHLFPIGQAIDTLTIGGGGYVFPRYIARHWPGSLIDVVEIDPAVTRAAEEAFGLDRGTIRSHHEDGRVFVDRINREGKGRRYTLIYLDALNGYQVPYQLTTLEFFQSVRSILREDGVLAMEMIDVFEPGHFLGAVVATLREVFPHVHVLTEGDSPEVKPKQRRTFVILALNRAFDSSALGEAYALDYRVHDLRGRPMERLNERAQFVLTDSYAPIENLLAGVVARAALSRALQDWLRAIRHAAELKRFEVSISRAQTALTLFSEPEPRVRILLELARVSVAAKQPDVAEQAAREAIELAPDTHEAHVQLANLLFSEKRSEEALVHMSEALRIVPDDPNRHYGLAMFFLSERRPEDAIRHLKEVIRLEPRLPEAYHRWGEALVLLGDSTEAVKQFSQALERDPAFGPALLDLAKTEFRLGRFSVALRHYDEVLLQNPDMIDALLGAAACLVRLQRSAEATDRYRQVIALDPENKEARKNLDALELP